MTTGSWDSSIPDNGSTKLVYFKNWSGADRVITSYPKANQRSVVRYSRKRKEFVQISFYEHNSSISRPPKRVLDVDHPYSMQLTKLRDRKVYFRTRDGDMNGPGYAMDNTAVPQWLIYDHNNPFSADEDLKLLGKLREKLSGSDFNLGVVLGEGHQVLSMIGDTAISLAKSIHHLKKGDFAGAARSVYETANRKPLKPYKQFKPFRPTADAVASHWLQLQYGWLPLLSDVKAGAEFVSHKLNVPVSKTVKFSTRKEASVTRFLDGNFDPTSCTALAYARKTMSLTVTESPSLAGALGLLDPSVVAWEVLPFSFVVDWFLPIGDWLDARSAVNSCTISQTVISTKVDSRCLAPTGAALVGDLSDVGYRRVSFNRTVALGAPRVPLPEVKPLSKALSVLHCLNGIALLEQAVSGSFTKRSALSKQVALRKLPTTSGFVI